MDVSQPDPPLPAAARAACAAWFGAGPLDVGPSPGTGFSGAAPFRVRPRGAAAWFVLKAFPPGTSRDRAAWIHRLACHLAGSGVTEVPRPLATPTGDTIVADAELAMWEVVPFIDGVATDVPDTPRATAALESLARLHAAAAGLSGAAPHVGASDGVTRRIERARELLARPWRSRRPPPRPGVDAFAVRLERAVAIFDAADGDRALAAVASARVADVPLQAVLRDVWSAHVLFARERPPRVAGIVDLHAAGIDTPATDLARLAGSWCRGPAADADPVLVWPEAIAAYESRRPLAAAERALVPFLHAAGIVCGLDNWFRWTLDEGREFRAPDAATARIDALLATLPAALGWLADRGAIRV